MDLRVLKLFDETLGETLYSQRSSTLYCMYPYHAKTRISRGPLVRGDENKTPTEYTSGGQGRGERQPGAAGGRVHMLCFVWGGEGQHTVKDRRGGIAVVVVTGGTGPRDRKFWKIVAVDEVLVLRRSARRVTKTSGVVWGRACLNYKW